MQVRVLRWASHCFCRGPGHGQEERGEVGDFCANSRVLAECRALAHRRALRCFACTAGMGGGCAARARVIWIVYSIDALPRVVPRSTALSSYACVPIHWMLSVAACAISAARSGRLARSGADCHTRHSRRDDDRAESQGLIESATFVDPLCALDSPSPLDPARPCAESAGALGAPSRCRHGSSETLP